MDRFIENLIGLYEKLSSWEHAVVRATELTLPQMHTVEIIGTTGTIRLKDLATRLGVTTGTLTTMIHRLEEQGIVVREKSANDGRSFIVRLTDQGTTLFRLHHNHHENLSRELAKGLTKKELFSLNTMLEKVVNNF